MISELLQFENPEVIAVAIGILVFIVMIEVLKNFRIERGPIIIASLAVSVYASWKLFNSGFYGLEPTLATVILLVIGLVVLKIVWSFAKGGRRHIG